MGRTNHECPDLNSLIKGWTPAGSARRIEQTNVTGFAADDGRCAAAAFTKKLNADSGYDNDPGLPDTTVQLAMCGGLALSLDEFIGRFGFATMADIAAYRPEKMRVNRPRGAVANMPNPETRPMTVSWQGFEALITGTAEISAKGLHDAKLHPPDGTTGCDGNFQGRRWTIVCDNGLTANGLYRLEDGAAGDGYDNRGRQVSFEVRG